MGQYRPHSAQTFSHAFNASGQIDYQSGTANARYSTGKSRARRGLETLEAHEFGDSGDELVDDGLRRIRRNVSRG